MSDPTIAKCVGSSHDGRTNRWRVTCPACGNVFEPQTTRLRYQSMVCPKSKCGKEMHVDYNAEPPLVELVGAQQAKKGEQKP